MDETQMVCVPLEPTAAITNAISHAIDNHNESTRDKEIYAAALAAAPTTHVAAKRETIRKCMALAYDAGQSAIAIELRNLLSQKGE